MHRCIGAVTLLTSAHFLFRRAHRPAGHNLCWGNNNPDWLTNVTNGTVLRGFLQDHIRAVVSHYTPRAYAWDVVNEALRDDEGLPGATPFKNNTWYVAQSM